MRQVGHLQEFSLCVSTMLYRLKWHGAQLQTFLNPAQNRGLCSLAHRSSGLVACLDYLFALKNREIHCL
jgi:hypothetical protein